MKKLIRRSTFETNSSSCHTLVLLSKDRPIITDDRESISLNPGEYGWGEDILTEVADKISYLCTYLVRYSYGDQADLFFEKFYKHFPSLKTVNVFNKSYSIEEFERLVREKTLDVGDSYIDHDSLDLASDVIRFWGFHEYLHEDAQLFITNDNTDYSPLIPKSKAQALGLTQELAEEIAKSYNKIPYELSWDLKEEIQELGGRVA